jgi:tRNA G18 (ribose-2'-O)-methylase SpoU
MADIQYKFYQCENPNCKLRFPGYDGYPRWNHCPACRSKINVVAIVKNETSKTGEKYLPTSIKLDALLDNIRSAWNVGSIFRTADGTGIRKLYLCGITPTPKNPKVSKTALGTEANILWEQSNNGLETVRKLKDQGYKIWVLENIPLAIPLYRIELSLGEYPYLIIVGNEVSGVDPGIIELSDQVVSIPMVGKKSSYNVSTAFGIAVSFLFYCQSFSQGSRKILPST